MSLTDTLKNTLSALTEGRAETAIVLDNSVLQQPYWMWETFSGKEFMSEALLLPGYSFFTSSRSKLSVHAQLLTKPATLTMGTGPV